MLRLPPAHHHPGLPQRAQGDVFRRAQDRVPRRTQQEVLRCDSAEVRGRAQGAMLKGELELENRKLKIVQCIHLFNDQVPIQNCRPVPRNKCSQVPKTKCSYGK